MLRKLGSYNMGNDLGGNVMNVDDMARHLNKDAEHVKTQTI